ncbi:MAG: HIT family protein [Betaproteobacteria bacterium]|nr:HIT family protein [Betaproteobacteria bacterium]
MNSGTCDLCLTAGGPLIWEDAKRRVIYAEEAAYPGFCRVIWREHVAEMSDLSRQDRDHLMSLVWATESALRELMHPQKINLASFGNVVPHLHWHVIPRFVDDKHYPEPVWGTVQREGAPRIAPAIETLRLAIKERLV